MKLWVKYDIFVIVEIQVIWIIVTCKYCAKTVAGLTFAKMHKVFLQATPLTLQ